MNVDCFVVPGNSRQDTISSICLELGQETISSSLFRTRTEPREGYNIKEFSRKWVRKHTINVFDICCLTENNSSQRRRILACNMCGAHGRSDRGADS